MTTEVNLALQPYLDALQKVISGSLFYLDPKNKTIMHSSPTLKKIGLPEKATNFPQCIFPLLHPDDVDSFHDYALKMFEGTTESHFVRYRIAAENFIYAKINSSPILDEHGDTLEILGKIDTMDYETALKERATWDPLTQALHEAYMEEYVNAVCQESLQNTFHALCLIQLDNWDTLKEEVGEEHSDFILSEFGKRMMENVRGKDLIGVVSDDKYVLLIRNIPNFDIVKRKSRQLLGSITTPFHDGTLETTISGGIGLSVFPEHGKNYTTLYQCSNMALTRSQERGSNTATIYKLEHGQIIQEN